MKKTTFFLLLACFIQASILQAQTAPSFQETDGAATGQLVLPDNSVVSGALKDNVRKKGELVLNAQGKKTKYNASGISRATVGGISYISRNFTFYEVLWEGKNYSLLRKASEPSSIQYNGSEPIVIQSEGGIDDLFLGKQADASVYLLTKKNVKEVFEMVCGSAGSVEPGKLDPETLKKAVQACDNSN